MLLAIVLLVFALHVAAWLVLPGRRTPAAYVRQSPQFLNSAPHPTTRRHPAHARAGAARGR